MGELPRHYPQLQESLTVLQQPGVVPAELQRARILCERVLQENPGSVIARQTLSRIEQLLGTQPSPIDQFRQYFAGIRAKAAPKLQSLTADEQRLDATIATYERNIFAFGNDVFLPQLERALASGGVDADVAEALKVPFAVYRQNVENPMKNFAVLQRVATEIGEVPATVFNAQEDPQRFAYMPLPTHVPGVTFRTAGGYAPYFRTMAIPTNDHLSLLDGTVGMHEAFHALQMIPARANLTQFLQFHLNVGDHKPRVITDYEFESYGLQLEAMNVLLDNKLRTAPGNGLFDHRTFMQAMQMPDTDEQGAQVFCILARAYFKEGGKATQGAYSENFKRGVRMICLQNQEVYEMHGNQLRRVLTP